MSGEENAAPPSDGRTFSSYSSSSSPSLSPAPTGGESGSENETKRRHVVTTTKSHQQEEQHKSRKTTRRHRTRHHREDCSATRLTRSTRQHASTCEEVGVQTEPMEPLDNRINESIRTTAFVVGAALISFVAFRNTLTWHLQQFWGLSGDFWQTQWESFHGWFSDEYFMGVWFTLFIFNSIFWVLNGLFAFVDLTGSPSFLRKYKVQEDTNFPVNRERYVKAARRVLVNQFVVGAPFMVLTYRLMKWRGCSFGSELPYFPYVVWQFFVMAIVEEIGFYYSHRLLHHPLFYKRIHKTHHEWTSPVSIVSLYSHPFEHILSGILPLITGPIIAKAHIATTWLWFVVATGSITIAHCGYHLPFMPSPEAHDYHHLKFNQNFGTLGILDRLHGTDAGFRKTKAYQRHFLLLSLVPVKSFFPDDVKKWEPFEAEDEEAAEKGASSAEGCAEESLPGAVLQELAG